MSKNKIIFDISCWILGVLVLGRWKTIVFRALRWGKVTTALQFIVLMGLTFGLEFPWYIYASFVAMGWLALMELVPIFRTRIVS